ncbi:MAG: nicotinate phosphoribosyltransferase [Propionibacteriaceae bacterium]
MTSFPAPADKATTALLTDHYELTMVRAALGAGTALRHSVFELFPRRLPTGRRYGVVAGVGRALDAIENFRFDEPTIDFLRAQHIIDDATAEYLATYCFRGNVWGYPEGEIYFPGAPLLVVEGTFAEACLLETVLLSIYNYDSAVASAASRMTAMASGRPCIEMGSRRTSEHSAVAAARAAWIAGFTATSNLEAGRRYGIPTTGTAAHSFTLLHDSEHHAFSAQIQALGNDTTLLVDTYDIAEAVKLAVELTNGQLGAVRIDSGDLASVAAETRKQLDALGADATRITVTSDLDEWQIAGLRAAPVDGYGVGTSLVTGSGAPTCGFVYKLVARAESADPQAPLIPVAKKSAHKNSQGGRKFALRRFDDRGKAEMDVIGVGKPPAGDANDRPLLVELIRNGEIIGREALSIARERHLRSRAELPVAALSLAQGDPAIDTVLVEADGSVDNDPYQQKGIAAPANMNGGNHS